MPDAAAAHAASTSVPVPVRPRGSFARLDLDEQARAAPVAFEDLFQGRNMLPAKRGVDPGSRVEARQLAPIERGHATPSASGPGQRPVVIDDRDTVPRELYVELDAVAALA
jgi:hypothetical protein